LLFVTHDHAGFSQTVIVFGVALVFFTVTST